MLRKTLMWIAPALAAAALAAPIAQAGTRDAEGFLRLAGMSPSQIEQWTTGVCSYGVRPAQCELTPAEGALASRRTAEGFLQLYGAPRTVAVPTTRSVSEAVGFLRLAGLSPGQILAWTTGVCSYPVKPSECELSPDAAALASQRTGEAFTQLYGSHPEVQVVRPGGFDWGDAAIGAAVTAGLFLLGAAGALAARRRGLLANLHL